MNQNEILALKILRYSTGEPITGARLAARIGIIKGNVGQQMRQVIHNLRVAGYPICASAKGYFYGTPRETEKFLAEFDRRIASQHKALEGMRRGLRMPMKSPDGTLFGLPNTNAELRPNA